MCVCVCGDRKEKNVEKKKRNEEEEGKLWRDFDQLSTHLTIKLESLRRLISDLNIICGKYTFILG